MPMKTKKNEKKSPKKVEKKGGTPKTQAKKSSKKTESKTSAPIEKKGKKSASRYTIIQQLLSDYCQKHGKKLGKKFNLYASEITKRTINDPIKQIENNFDLIYSKYVEGSNVPDKKFPNEFEYYYFADKLVGDIVLDGVMIGVKFDDGTEKFNHKAFASDMWFYYTQNMHKYLRLNYNDSPVAWFDIEDTDNKTYVNYVVRVDSAIPMPTPKGQGGGKKKEPKAEEPKSEKPVESEADKQAERQLELAKIQADIEKSKASQEKSKAITQALQDLKSGLITKADFDLILRALS